jgi:hypothetical protein
MKRQLRCHEVKRDVTFPYGAATLHFSCASARFISKKKSTAIAVLFFLRRIDKKDAA